MSERDALLRAVLDNPAENSVRLAFADWLDETGRPWDAARAELIRLQIGRLGAWPAAVADSLKREEAILKRWGAKWLPRSAREDVERNRMTVLGETVATITDDGLTTVSYVFERGFPSWVRAEVRLSHSPRPSAKLIARFARERLAANPVEVFHLEATGFDPAVQIRLEAEEARWRMKIVTDAGSELSSLHDTRRAACAFLPTMLADWLPGVNFQPTPIPF